MKRSGFVFSLAIVLILLVGCNSQKKTKASEEYVTPLLETYWKLSSLHGEPMRVRGPREAYVIFKAVGGKVQGHGGCNSFQGVLHGAKNNVYTVESLSSTEMACDALEIEQEFFEVLRSDLIYVPSNDTLILKDKDGKKIATFEAVYF